MLSNRTCKVEIVKQSANKNNQKTKPIRDSKSLIEKNELISNELTKNVQDQEKFEFFSADEFWEDDLYSSSIGCHQTNLI